ncbi:GNAT family N-acetyltransferase [Candidatus Acetothermia bacterium]|nr:GNAT family N-acetyltransferase [Candidatus Acetothermia bacterium]
MLDRIKIIEEYREELAAPMAAMFNSWDELWPGGFSHGVPYTAERVHKWLGPAKMIAVLIALDQGQPIGFLSLLSHWREPDAVYIGIFGVSPNVVGTGVGKRLLLRAITIAAQKDYRRVDLHTWAGNLSAVPLYKKAGFMWNPDTDGVCFQSYIPAILTHPLSAPFFQAHPDWYAIQQRELTQAPDGINEKGMDLFSYHFAVGDDSLRVTVDRYARAITGVKRVIGKERLQIDARVAKHLVLCGLPAAYYIEIENGTSEEIDLSVSLHGFPGLEFDGGIDPGIRTPAGESSRLRVSFNLDRSAPLYRKELKSPAITATLKADNQEFSLATGLKIKPVAEIYTEFGECRVVPGSKVPLPITITSNTAAMLRGKLSFDLADLPITISPAESEIEITPEGLAGVVVEVIAPAGLAPGTYDLWASLHFTAGTNGGAPLTTRRFRIPLFCIPDGAVAVGEDDRKREVLVVSRDYTARLSREGGDVEITVPGASLPTISLDTEIGPPFGLDPFSTAEREVDVKRSASATTVSLSATHPERSLRVETRLIFFHNSPLICQETWVTNQGVENQTFQLRIEGYQDDDVSLTTGRKILPLSSGVVHDRIASHLSDHPSIPDDPVSFSESWIAVEGSVGASGQVWEHENLEEIEILSGRIGRLGYRPVTLKPKEERSISQIWHLTQTTGWKAVRRLWQEKIAHRIPLASEIAALPAALPILQIAPPLIVLPHRRLVTSEFTFDYPATAPLSGPLSVEAPAGWSASLSREEEKSDTRIMVTDLNRDNLPALRLTLTPGEEIPDRFALFTGHLRLATPVEKEEPFTIVQLGTAKDTVEIAEETKKSHSVLRINNGLIEFAVSADYGGCLFSLKNALGTELLASAFPTPAPKVFLQNYWGGVQPIIGGVDEDPFQAKTNREKMQARICRQGDLWKGVEINWQGKVQQICRGVEFRLSYLTAPGSPLIVINWTIHNSTTAPLRLIPMLVVDVAFDGDLSNTILQARWDGTLTDIRQGVPPATFSPDANFSWLRRTPVGAGPSEGLAFLTAGTVPKMLALYLDEGCWLAGIESDLWLQPGEKRTLRSCIFVDPQDSAVLERLQPLLNDLSPLEGSRE